jgi:hypothetical protein
LHFARKVLKTHLSSDTARNFLVIFLNHQLSWFLKMVGPKKQDFWPKSNILKGNHCILRIRGAPVGQKLGITLGNKVAQKLELERNVFLQKMVSKIDILK